MWSREELKARAKLILKFNYWKAFLVTLIGAFVGGNSGAASSYYSSNYSSQMNNGSYGYNFDFNIEPAIILFISMIILFASIIGLAFYFFVGGPFKISSAKYFVAQREQLGNLNYLSFGFSKGKYLNNVKAMAWSYLFTWLWSLLFIIPGIVKGYAYSMIPYIMAENPDMNYQQAMKLSMHMTQGLKGDMFIMDLSFIGWNLLGLMLCGVGIFFVRPYYAATIAEMYVFIRERAIMLNICPRETFMPNFGQIPPTYQSPIF